MLRAERCTLGRKKPRADFGFLLVAACLGCGLTSGDGNPSPGVTRGDDPLAEVHISREIITGIERTLGVPTERALALATEDALLALELTRTRPALARSMATLALARVLLQTMRQDVAREEPVRDDEIEVLARERWWEFERPRMVRVVHAVVLTQTEDARAEALALQIRAAVSGSPNAAEFTKAAERVTPDGFSVKIEKLPPIAPDGRSVEPDRAPPLGPPVRNMAAEFAEAATRLTERGDLSPVVRSPFGYHVIQLLGTVEPLVLAAAERRALLEEGVLVERARKRKDDLLAKLRRELQPEQSRSASSAMETVRAEP